MNTCPDYREHPQGGVKLLPPSEDHLDKVMGAISDILDPKKAALLQESEKLRSKLSHNAYNNPDDQDRKELQRRIMASSSKADGHEAYRSDLYYHSDQCRKSSRRRMLFFQVQIKVLTEIGTGK